SMIKVLYSQQRTLSSSSSSTKSNKSTSSEDTQQNSSQKTTTQKFSFIENFILKKTKQSAFKREITKDLSVQFFNELKLGYKDINGYLINENEVPDHLEIWYWTHFELGIFL